MATVMELKARADAYGLRNYDRLNKTQLESLISKHDQLACEQHKPIPQPVIFRFEVNELYYDNFAWFTVIERTDTHVTFKNVGSEKVSCRKVSITRTHVGYCETATLTNYNGERCYPTARPTSKTDDAFSKVTREISIRKAKEAYASFLQGQCVDSVPKTTRITVITVEQAVEAIQSATTAEEVQAVLEQCKKDQIHEVFLAVTGAENELCAKIWKKAELVNQYTARIVAFKAREAFKAMDTQTRAEYLASGKFQQDGNTVDKLTWKLSPYELITLNAALGVNFEEYKDIREGHSTIASLKACIRHAARSARSVKETKTPFTEISKPKLKAETAFRQWKENFKGKDEFAFYATNDYLALLDVIASSKEVVSKEVDTYAAHWYIESGRSSREFRRVLLNTDPRKVVKFLNAAVFENTDNQVNAMRIAMGLATAESISWQERISQRRISKLIASIEAEYEVKPDYDAAFDEPAYVPEVQEVSVIVDDIPADHEADTQPEVSPSEVELPETKATVSIDYAAIVNADISTGKPENMSISDQIYNALTELSEEDLITLAESERMYSVIACYDEIGLSKRGLVLSIGGVITNRLKKLTAGEELPSGYQEVIHDKYGSCVVDVPLDTPMIRAFHEYHQPENEASISASVEVKADVQEVSTPSKETVSRSKKKTRKSSRKSHTQYWEQFSQSKSKTSRHNPNSKPLIKATRAALSVRIKKF